MENIIKESEQSLIHSYNRYQVVLDHGEDVYLYDTNGKKYLDFGAGIAVCALGYSNEDYKNAMKAQIDKGLHFSNYFYSEPLKDAAIALTNASGMEKIFFANSGGEANEGAIKLARKYAILNGHEHRTEIISMNKAFHGRSLGSLSVTGTKKYRESYEGILPKVHFAEYNDLDSVKKLVNDNVFAIFMEPIQGEGGIYPATKEFIEGVRKICNDNDIMMIFDEVQCGMGRSGKMFAYMNYEVKPDIITMAKGIGNGMTVGAFATSEKIGKCMVPGDHGTTFGGNPLAATAVKTTLSVFEKMNILDNVNEIGDYLKDELNKLAEKKDIVTEVRGMGLMVGLELKEAAGDYVAKALDKGVIFMSAGTNVIRMVPPLIIEKKHVDEMIKVLDEIL